MNEQERRDFARFLVHIGYGVDMTPTDSDAMPEYLRPYLVDAWCEAVNAKDAERDDYREVLASELGWGGTEGETEGRSAWQG